MIKAPRRWTVLLAVAPPLLEELLSTLLRRVDLDVSTLGAGSGPLGPSRFDVGVHDHPLPAWIEVDHRLPIQAGHDEEIGIPPSETQLKIDTIEGLRGALQALCPPRGIDAVAD